MAGSSAHRLMRCGSCTDGHQPAQEEQAVGTNGEQGFLEELSALWSSGSRAGATEAIEADARRTVSARFSSKRPDRFGVCLGETLSILKDLFESGS